jgi:hypothetical protein
MEARQKLVENGDIYIWFEKENKEEQTNCSN